MRPRVDKYGQWRGYDLPIWRDRMFQVACAAGVVCAIFGAVFVGGGWGEIGVSLVAVPSSVGIVGGSIRNFRRGLRDPASPHRSVR